MDVQSNLDLSQTDQGKTSISSDGLSRIPETQIRKTIYKDDTTELIGVLDTDGRFYIHSILSNPNSTAQIRKNKDILANLEIELANRGINRYYTFADSPINFRYNEMMGFQTNLEVWDGAYEVMFKDTN